MACCWISAHESLVLPSMHVYPRLSDTLKVLRAHVHPQQPATQPNPLRKAHGYREPDQTDGLPQGWCSCPSMGEKVGYFLPCKV